MSEEDSDKYFAKGEEDQSQMENNPFDDDGLNKSESPEERPKKLKKMKKDKKHKKEKKEKNKEKKKKRHYEEEDDYGFDDEEEEDDQGYNSFFEEEAESGEEEDQGEGQFDDEEERMRFNQIYNRGRATDNYMDRFQGKNQRQINAQYTREATKRRENEQMYPGAHDPKLYIVNVKPRHEEEMVLKILNKAKIEADSQNRVTIVSALAMKKKFPGKIFIEAFHEKDVHDSLDGFNYVNLSRKLLELDADAYADLFNSKTESKYDFEQHSYVRIKKGLYEGDLAKIFRVKSNSVDVLIVPRINTQQIITKIKEQTSQIQSREEREKKEEELLKIFVNHKTNYYRNRPNNTLLTQENYDQLKNSVSGMKAIRVSYREGHIDGLIVLNYKFDEIMKVQGTYLPVQVLPFTSEGNFIDQIKEDKRNFAVGINFKKGELVQIIAGELIGHYGTVLEIRDNIGVIECKSKDKEMNGEILYELLDHLTKKFRERERVKVISGADTGKTGIILKIEPKLVEIWTQNENSIKINKKNLELHHGEVICQQNVHNLKKDDLIRTTKGLIGIVLETRKDSMKLLDMNNTIRIVGSMDFDSHLNTRNLTSKNRMGQEINPHSIVIIRQGIHQVHIHQLEGKRCKVIHVFKEHVFLFNQSFDRTAGIAVENVDNCSLIAKNDTSKRNNQKPQPSSQQDTQEQLTINKTIVLKSGPLKGYQGIIKSINKDKIQVRVPSKSTTVIVERDSVKSKQEGMEAGKTPNRRGGTTHIYSASPKF